MNKTRYQQSKVVNSKYFVLLAAIYITILLSTVPISYRMISIGSAVVSAAAFYIPLMFSLGDIIAEVYGYQMARQVLWCAIMADIVFAVLITLGIHFPAAPIEHYQDDYNVVLGHVIHGVLGGATAILIGSFINIFILSKWKILIKGKLFWLRSFFSSTLGEAALYALGNLIAFLGVIPMGRIMEIIFSMYLIQVVYSFIMVWPASIIVALLKKAEGINIFDYHTDFNPFRFQVSKNINNNEK